MSALSRTMPTQSATASKVSTPWRTGGMASCCSCSGRRAGRSASAHYDFTSLIAPTRLTARGRLHP
jgi:hypothetical protein